MAKATRGPQRINTDHEPDDKDGASFAWEFESDASGSTRAVLPSAMAGTSAQANRHPRRATQTTPRIVTQDGTRSSDRGELVRQRLDHALERWWADGSLPSLDLLRDALLLLEGGGSVSESQRTLLLRSALAYDRGVQTALRHQADAERTALVLTEALVEWAAPLEVSRVVEIVGSHAPLLQLVITELERSSVLLSGEAQRRSQAALAVLSRLRVTAPQSAKSTPPPFVVSAGVVSPRVISPRQKFFRRMLLLLLLITLLGFVYWQRRQSAPQDMISMPAASYALLQADGAPVAVPLEAYFIDRHEVTNAQYRSCIEQGRCQWPTSTASATRSSYFMDPAFNRYPVVFVTQAMAAAYCSAQGKRLPTAEEWQAAASVSPTTGQVFRYPWGMTFEAQRANSASSGFGDTLAVGSFRPGGNSPSGAADMAGNAAEWTSILRGEGMGPATVKGGSFGDEGDALFVGAATEVEANHASAEIGFRCARSHLLAQE